MVYDYSKLLGRITEIFKNQANFAKAMGLSERTISLKLTQKIGWRQNEIVRACDVLHIGFDEIPVYFFVLKVQ